MQLYQVHVFTRGKHSGLSCWVAMRPSGHNAKPYLFTFEEAQNQVRDHAKNGHVGKTRIVEN